MRFGTVIHNLRAGVAPSWSPPPPPPSIQTHPFFASTCIFHGNTSSDVFKDTITLNFQQK
jgi:hypothetical protein